MQARRQVMRPQEATQAATRRKDMPSNPVTRQDTRSPTRSPCTARPRNVLESAQLAQVSSHPVALPASRGDSG